MLNTSACEKHLLFLVTSLWWKISLNSSLSLSLLCFPPLSLPVQCDWFALCHCALWRKKVTAGGGDIRSLLFNTGELNAMKNTPSVASLSSFKVYWLWICNISSCAKDLQHFLLHAWKGKTGGLTWFKTKLVFKYLELCEGLLFILFCYFKKSPFKRAVSLI